MSFMPPRDDFDPFEPEPPKRRGLLLRSSYAKQIRQRIVDDLRLHNRKHWSHVVILGGGTRLFWLAKKLENGSIRMHVIQGPQDERWWGITGAVAGPIERIPDEISAMAFELAADHPWLVRTEEFRETIEVTSVRLAA